MPHTWQGQPVVRTGGNLGIRWNRMGAATRTQTLGFVLGALSSQKEAGFWGKVSLKRVLLR